ncbi:hypothetical protein GCK32_007334 [Trichostrongylus colubriformis]|uniref:Uncharacterized protein n=1 Tax=Trichostrongylus colubriformis TaxID=6319 RepID=A0AAN8IJP0_TRICO
MSVHGIPINSDLPDTTMEQDEPMDTGQRSEPSGERLLRDSDIAAIIAAIKEDQPSSSTQATTPNPSFNRKGYGSQYEFNISLLQKLNRLNRAGMEKKDDELIKAILEMINVRNETLKIADKHPGVFSFLESKKQAEAVKSSNPFLSEFLEQVQKEEKRTKKTRSSSPGTTNRPFEGGNRHGASIPDHTNTCRGLSTTPTWTTRDFDTASRLARLTRDSAETSLRDEKNIDVTSVQIRNKLITNGAVKEVPESQNLMIHPLSVAEGEWRQDLVSQLSVFPRVQWQEHSILEQELAVSNARHLRILASPGLGVRNLPLDSPEDSIRRLQWQIQAPQY